MKKGWERKKFESCIVPVGYTRKIQRKDFLGEGRFPIISQEAAFINGRWNDEADVFKVSSPVVIFGDHTQTIKYVDFDFVLGADGVKILQPQDFLCPKFLYYQLHAVEIPTLGYARHYRLLKEMEIVYPPLDEQQRIVAILDEAFAGIATAQANAGKNLHNARALFESHLNHVFTKRGEGWVEKSLGDIAQVKGGKRVPKGYKLLVEPTEFPYLRVADFNDSGTIDMSDLRYVSNEVRREIIKYVIYSDDMYISIAGTIGKTGIIPQELDGANLTENACRLVFREEISNRFVYYYSKTSDFEDQAGLNTRTAAQPKLALSRLSTIRLAVPSLALQESIANQLDSLATETRRLESIYQQKLDELAALKKSLLHQAFSGEL